MTFTYNGDNDIYVTGLTDTRTGSYITTAVVTATITDRTTNLQVGSAITLALLNAGGSTTIYNYPSIGVNTVSAGGNYLGSQLAALGLVKGRSYELDVVSVVGANQTQLSAILQCSN